MVTATSANPLQPLTRAETAARVRNCGRLPSLATVASALRELLDSSQCYTSQISDVIRRDPSLTARLLHLVNSVCYGFTTPLSSIEEAVFYLGDRQIRQLALVTPVIEDLRQLVGSTPFAWREFWQHCIGTAMLTREVFSSLQAPDQEADYIAGLLHDVGKIVMAAAFPAHFMAICQPTQVAVGLRAREHLVLGMDHAELGAIYLEIHSLPEVLVETARFHHEPERAGRYAPIVAAVQIADLLMHHAQAGENGNPEEVSDAAWLSARGWRSLVPDRTLEERASAHAHLQGCLARLPQILEALV